MNKQPITLALDTDVTAALRVVQAKDKRRRPLGKLVSDALRQHRKIRAELAEQRIKRA